MAYRLFVMEIDTTIDSSEQLKDAKIRWRHNTATMSEIEDFRNLLYIVYSLLLAACAHNSVGI